MINTHTKLSGERHAPELGIPRSAITAYADRYGFSEVFIDMVQIYDSEIMSRINNRSRNKGKALKGGTGTKNKTAA